MKTIKPYQSHEDFEIKKKKTELYRIPYVAPQEMIDEIKEKAERLLKKVNELDIPNTLGIDYVEYWNGESRDFNELPESKLSRILIDLELMHDDDYGMNIGGKVVKIPKDSPIYNLNIKGENQERIIDTGIAEDIKYTIVNSNLPDKIKDIVSQTRKETREDRYGFWYDKAFKYD